MPTSVPDNVSLNLTGFYHSKPHPILTTFSESDPYRLQLAQPLHLKDSNFHWVTMCPECPGNWRRIGRCKWVVVGDTKFTPLELNVVPGLFSSDPGNFSLMLYCVRPPLSLPKGQIVAQAFLMPELGLNPAPPFQSRHPAVAWAQVLGREKKPE